MGIGRNKYTIHKVGEYAQKANETYYGGSPAGVNQNGQLILAKSGVSDIAYVGIFANYSGVDSNTQQLKSTFYAGTCVLTLMKGVPNLNNSITNVEGTTGVTGDDFPYDTTKVYNEADLLYVDSNGKWTNVNPGSKEALGVVLVAGTNYLTVLFNNKAGATI